MWLHESLRPPLTAAAAGRLRRDVLSAIAACYLGRAVDAAEFGRGAHGRPVLRTGGTHDFNLSQSGRLIAVAVTVAGRIGIDVERVRPVGGVLALAAEAFGPAAVQELAALGEPGRSIRFLEYWTRLEALVKAAGADLSQSMALFRAAVLTEDLPAAFPAAGAGNLAVRNIALGTGYRGAIAFSSAPARFSLLRLPRSAPPASTRRRRTS